MWSVVVFFKGKWSRSYSVSQTPSAWAASYCSFFIPTKVNSLQTEHYSLPHHQLQAARGGNKSDYCGLSHQIPAAHTHTSTSVPLFPHLHPQTWPFFSPSLLSLLPCVCVLWPLCQVRSLEKLLKLHEPLPVTYNISIGTMFSWKPTPEALVAVFLCMEVGGRGRKEQAKKGCVINISIRNLN